MSLQVVSNEPDDFRARVVIPLPERRFMAAGDGPRPMIDVVVPVQNAELHLAPIIRRLRAYLAEDLPFSSRITIADAASTDGTFAVAWQLAAEFSEVRVLHLSEKGRARALAAAWLTSDARVVAEMDVDASADLSALLPLLAPVISGHTEISIGSRHAAATQSNLLVRLLLGAGLREVQCGCKAMRADVARRLVREVVSRDWLFDTELLVRAERAGLRIHELPAN
jgi:glycosyltransferase involved in cell wall biosynthesis